MAGFQWRWTQFGDGWIQDGDGYRAAGIWCGVWDAHGREWSAQIVAKQRGDGFYLWKWQCRAVDDATFTEFNGDKNQAVMFRDRVVIQCDQVRWDTPFAMAPAEALIACQAALMAMGFSDYPPQNPLTISRAMAEDLLQLQGLRL